MEDENYKKIQEMMESLRDLEGEPTGWELIKKKDNELQRTNYEIENTKAFLADTKARLLEADDNNVANKIRRDEADYSQKLNKLIVSKSNLEAELQAMLEHLQKGKNFDKMILFSNIRNLLKTKDIKLGQIEREAGCQPGYMSRLEKAGNTSDPSVEFVVTASKMFGIPVDVLISMKVGTITPTEEYVLRFLNGLIEDTCSDELIWECESREYLDKVAIDDHAMNGVTHPLFTGKEYLDHGKVIGLQVCYNSKFYPEEQVDIFGDCYNAKLIGTDAHIYFMDCAMIDCLGEQQNFFEMYVVGETVEPICCSLSAVEIVSNTMQKLNEEIKRAKIHVHLKENAKSVIDKYLEMRKFLS